MPVIKFKELNIKMPEGYRRARVGKILTEGWMYIDPVEKSFFGFEKHRFHTDINATGLRIKKIWSSVYFIRKNN